MATLESDDRKTQVAVKILKDGASTEVQEDFDREVEIMSAFDHDNVLKLLGVITQGSSGSPCMIFEFMEHGDLTEVLRRNDPYQQHVTATAGGHSAAPSGTLGATSDQADDRVGLVLNKADLVDISVQIANGMSYLACQHFVHRDLATRNCLVGAGLVVKISDFGMSRDIYTNDYYRIGGSRMLPVRWMSPDAIKYGCFTCESDIWAYGVVLWEIFSFGKQPYYGHTNEEVIHFLDQGILLQRPDDCPSTIYHVMIGCWKKDPRQRIVFERLVKYLGDYRSRLIDNQRQQQQHFQHHQEQQQQQQPQQYQQQHQRQQEKEEEEQQQQTQQKEYLTITRSDSGGSAVSQKTEATDVANTPDQSDPLVPLFAAAASGGHRNISSNSPSPAAVPDTDDRYAGPQLQQSCLADCKTRHGPLLQASIPTQKPEGLLCLKLPTLSPVPSLPSSPVRNSPRRLTLPKTGKSTGRSKFKASTSKVLSSPRIPRAFSSKKAKKAASYSTLPAEGSHYAAVGDTDSAACDTETTRRFSSGEVSVFESVRGIRSRKVPFVSAVESIPSRKYYVTPLPNSKIINPWKGSPRGGLLMDNMYAGSKRSSPTLNTYDTSLLRATSFKSAGALPLNKGLLSEGPSNIGAESRSTGIRLEWSDFNRSMLRRAQSQKESLIKPAHLNTH